MEVSELIKKNGKWLLLSAALCLFILLVYALKTDNLSLFDQRVYAFVSNSISPSLTPFMQAITEMGGTAGMIIICAVSALCLLWMRKRRLALCMITNLVITAASNVVLKHIFSRPRPSGYRLIEISGYSFPSGHSMASLAFYGFLIYLVWHKVEIKWQRYLLCTLLSGLILLIMVSRIYLGVHYASDVLAGASIALIILILFTAITRKHSLLDLKDIKD